MIIKIKMPLFEWFCDCIYKATGKKVAGSPVQAMKAINAPVSRYPWLRSVLNNIYSIDEKDGLPELEEIDRRKKRKNGQFYTPIRFVKLLLKDENFYANQMILDPACGSGNFLIHIAEKLNELNISSSNVYGYDIDGQALLVCLGRFMMMSNAKSWPQLELRNFLFDRGFKKFDLVIGNPPYKVNLTSVEKEMLAKSFTTGEGEKDLYTFFIEAGIRSLQKLGKIIFLTSNTYLVNKQCNKIRNYIFVQHNVTDLYFLPYRFFVHAPGVLPVVLVLKNEQVESNLVKLHSQFSYEKGWEIITFADSSLLSSPSGMRRAFISKDLMNLFIQMEKTNKTLGDICKIRVGIQEASKRGDIISKFVSETKKNKEYKPVLKGREISQFGIDWEGKYIHYGNHLTYAGDPDIYENKKILYQNIRNEKMSNRLVAALDEDKFYPKNSLTTISNISEAYSMEFILGLLNSKLVNTWFYGNYYSFHITVTQVKTIPMPFLDSNLVVKIEDLVREVINLRKANIDISDLIHEMNLLIYKLYFPNMNVKCVERLCHNFLEQMARL